ncbi:MAG: hypothetical protein A3K76_03625 [Euryarchaeota archaeon RBG_13_57_23]|nr:MAG: hypothetical protein A3K76_03625 [Euryarchaeota archaeon RBG_13_57_23]
MGKVMAIGSGDPSVEEPLPPYYIAGYTYDALGTILPFCDVNVTDKTTDAYMVGTSSDLGFYMLDVKNGMVSTGGFTAGDVINVTATKDLAVGWNETVSLAGSFTPIDVTLDAMIPEFPMVALPVVGLLAMFIVVSVRRRGKQ